MSKKVSSILCYCTIIPWLIAFFSNKDNKKEISKNLTQGLILAILDCIFLVNIPAIIFSIMAIVKIAKGEEEQPDVPIISSWGWDWFNK